VDWNGKWSVGSEESAGSGVEWSAALSF